MRLPVPTRRLALVVAVAAVVPLVLGRAAALWATLAVVAVAAVVDLVLAPPPASIGVDRHLAAAATIGSATPISWTLTNPGSRSSTVSMADELAPSLGATTRRVHVRVGAGEAVEVESELRPTRRGRFEPTAVVVRTEGPLGLLARQRTRDVPGRLQVQPRFVSRDAAELRLRRVRGLQAGLRTVRGLGGGTEFDQLREYGPDDESRRIDWAATARASRPIVRTYRAEQNQSVVVLLDNGRVMAGLVDGVPRVEHAMDAAMALTVLAAGVGDRVGMVAFDTEVRAVVPPSAGRQQLGRVIDVFPGLDPVLAESDYAGAFTEALARFRRRSLLVVLTDLVEQALLESLLPALPLVVRRHRVLVAAVQDPAVARWADSAPDDADAAYLAAAAGAALEERRRAAARLRALGAEVIDAVPGELAPRLCDAYLDVKATGRL